MMNIKSFVGCDACGYVGEGERFPRPAATCGSQGSDAAVLGCRTQPGTDPRPWPRRSWHRRASRPPRISGFATAARESVVHAPAPRLRAPSRGSTLVRGFLAKKSFSTLQRADLPVEKIGPGLRGGRLCASPTAASAAEPPPRKRSLHRPAAASSSCRSGSAGPRAHSPPYRSSGPP